MARRPFILPFSNISFATAAKALAADPEFACIDARGLHPRGSETGRYRAEARCSIIAANPNHTFSFAGGFATLDGHVTIDSPMNALMRFASLANDIPVDPYLPAGCGAIGYVSFEGAKALRGFAPASGFSRYSQCRFGIYPTLVVFDHAEGTSWIQATDPDTAERDAHHLLGRLSRTPIWNAPEKRTGVPPDRSVRFAPATNAFEKVVSSAHTWLRADRLGRVHLARHLSRPELMRKPIDLFLSNTPTASVQALLTQEGASFILRSSDLLFDVVGDRVHSRLVRSPSGDEVPVLTWSTRVDRERDAIALEHQRGLLRTCETESLSMVIDERSGDVTFTGRRRPELSPLSGLIGLIPSAAVTGTPINKAMTFIGSHEDVHRSLYGGAFGTFDAQRLSFRTIQKSIVFGDGETRCTAGIDVTAETDVHYASWQIASMLTSL